MKLTYAGNLVVTSSWPRLLGIACTATSLVLAGCSSYETSTPKAAVNYHGPPATEKEVHVRSLEDVIKANRDWYQMNDG
jgi:hypothetical protein